eukprot:gene19464-19177_t
MASGLEWAVHKYILHGEPSKLPHPLCTWAVEHRAHHNEVAAGSLLLNHQGTAKGVFFGWSATIGFIISIVRGVGLKPLTDGYCNLGFVLPQAIAPVAILSALVCGVSVWLATLLHCAGAIIDVGVHNYAHAREHGRRTCSWRQALGFDRLAGTVTKENPVRGHCFRTGGFGGGPAGVVYDNDGNIMKEPWQRRRKATLKGPIGQGMLKRSKECADAHCSGQGRCIFDSTCECYAGYSGNACSSVRSKVAKKDAWPRPTRLRGSL